MEWDNCNPQPGDLIEIDRVLYQHWALYVGDGYLIHVTDVGSKGAITPVGSGSNLTGNAKVKKEVVKDVVKNHKWRVNNKYDRSRTPLPVEEIIQNAESLVGLEIPYNLFKNNCEHFVTLLRYDDKFCDQVIKALRDGTTVALGSIIVGAVAVAAAALFRGLSRI